MLEPYFFFSILLLTGFFAGLVDSIAGGGGLITLPVLLSLGFSPHDALGTNKFQASFGSFTASYYYVKKGGVKLKETVTGIISTLIGATIGVIAVEQVSSKALNFIIPFLLIGIIIYSFKKTNIGELETHAHFTPFNFYLIFGILFGFYDGFFGPGVGSFWAFAFIAGLGYSFPKATGYTKVMNFTSNIVSLFIFLINGNIFFTAGIFMASGEILGAKIGSGLVIKKGARFIRPIFITVVIITTLKLLFDKFLH
jgi:uncharacterized membrane protein YfcA